MGFAARSACVARTDWTARRRRRAWLDAPVDLYETAHEYILTAELAGLTRTDIDIHAEDFRIVIRGERGAPSGRDLPCEQYHRVERGHGRFSRAFSLPEAIAVDRVSADLKDGILTVMMPKAADRAAHRIDVS